MTSSLGRFKPDLSGPSRRSQPAGVSGNPKKKSAEIAITYKRESVADFSPMSDLIDMHRLNVEASRVTDFRPLTCLANLKNLRLGKSR